MTPIQLTNETLRAFDAFKTFVAMGPKRSIRKAARKLNKNSTTIAEWSKKYRWQKRLRELELEDCKRAVAADEQAKLDVAKERERERTLFQQRAIEVSRRATEKGLQILRQPLKGTRPADAARLLCAADAIGRAALGLSGESTAQTGHFGLRPIAPPNIRVVVRTDAHSEKVKELEDEFFKRHPALVRPRNGLESDNGTGMEH
jgi:hypothetical protein